MPTKNDPDENAADVPHIPTRVHAEAAPQAQYDPTYFERHDARNRPRIEAIMANMTPGDRVLDIGCNRGYFSRAVLDLGLAPHADGVEPSAESVDPELLEDPRFTLHEGDIFALEFPTTYHAVIYCAVHHHVFGHRGYGPAFALWQRIVQQCDRHIFFETGQMLEGSRWYWQRALRRHYPSDEQHFAELLQAIGPRLESVKVIGKHMIHGTRRWLLRINLLPRDLEPPRAQAEHDPGRYEVLARYRRGIGSRDQALTPYSTGSGESAKADQGTVLHEGVELALCRDSADGEQVWCKRRPADPYRDQREFMIGAQITEGPFVSARAIDPEVGLVFPYVAGEKLSEVDLRTVANRSEVIEQLIDLYELAERTMIDTGALDIDPRERNVRRSLIDLIDLHPGNIMVEREAGSLRITGVIDLEYYRNHNRARNAMHFAGVLTGARAVGPRALKFLAKARLLDARDRLRWNRAPLEDRLFEGRGTGPRKLIMRAREAKDRALRFRPGHWQ